MKIIVQKSDNVEITLRTSTTDPLSVNEMRELISLALQQEWYSESYIEELFNLNLAEPECAKAYDTYFTEELEKQEVKTTKFEDKAKQIVDVMENTLGSVKILWVVRDRDEMQEAVQALDLEFFKDFNAQQVEDVIIIKKSVDYSSPILERFLSVTISTRFYENNFTAVI